MIELTVGQRLILRYNDGTERESAIERITKKFVFARPHGRLDRSALECWGRFYQRGYGCTWLTEEALAGETEGEVA